MKIPYLHANIRTQVLFLSSGIVLVSFLTFLPYVIFKFTEDKKRVLHERILQMSQNSQEKTDSEIDNYRYKATFLTLGNQGHNNVDSMTPFLHYRFKINGINSRLVSREDKKQLLAKYSTSENTEKKLLTVNTSELDFKRNRFSTQLEIIDNVPSLSVFIKSSRGDEVDAYRFIASDVNLSYQNSDKLKNFLLDEKKGVIIGDGSLKIEKSLVDRILENKSAGSSFDETIQGKDYLIGFSKHRNTPWISVTMVEKDEIYSILYQMIRKLIGIAGIILSLSMLAGALIAKNIIGPINQLLQGTKEILNKNYHHRIRFTKDNEFKKLADSFNTMSGEILNYIEEVKEKTRMEKELEVAELVQHSFLPPNGKCQSQNLEIAGYYQSASECGGDWWDVREIGDKTLVFIADATGHGVPAALITSAAHSCSSMIPRMAESRPELLESPSKIAEFFNDSVFGACGTIHMTMFVGVYDKKTSELKYANASHIPPLLYRATSETPSRKDLHPLLAAEGFRLGHKKDPQYTEGKTTLNEGDVLYLYTDGIIEAVDPAGNQFGDRKFQKKILEVAKSDLESQLNLSVTELQSYMGSHAPDDDISLVMISRKKSN